tara:strand:+ start:638 stop:874 length:237 start_codon:yes stop_codon:yes gene_type:complete
MSDTQKGYDFGHKLALDALEQAEEQGQDFKPSDIFAGLLTTITHALYYASPTEEHAEEIISFATTTAFFDWEEEKKSL